MARESPRPSSGSAALHALAVAALAAPALAAASGLEARFLGNNAVELTDGETTILTDFPYRSGAFGYMRYDTVELRLRPGSLCLVTHGHADHFAPELVERIGCRVAAPEGVAAGLPPELRLAAAEEQTFGTARIRALPTPHGDVAHRSYRIDWAGVALFLTGDTERLPAAALEPDLDAVLLTPWLAAEYLTRGGEASRAVVLHHRSVEEVDDCPGCRVPAPSERWRLEPAPRR